MTQDVSQDNARCGAVAEGLLADLEPSGRGREDQALAVVELRIHGLAGFLSHSDLLRVSQRACVRAEIGLAYSQGFNPHPRLSMPLPKSVGLESEGDIVLMRVSKNGQPDQAQSIHNALQDQWPEGIEVVSVSLVDSGYRIYPHQADYHITVQQPETREALFAKVDEVMAQETLYIERNNLKKKYKTKQLDFRSYVQAIIKTDGGIVATCRIREDGAIRVEEMLEVLGLSPEDLGEPIQRKRLVWRLN